MRLPQAVACAGLVVAASCDGAEQRPAAIDTAGVPPGGGVNASAEPVVDTTAVAGAPRPASPGDDVPSPAAATVTPDTALGTVRLIGTALDARVVVQTQAGPLGIAGRLAPAISRLDGMDVWIQGPIAAATGRAIPPRQITAQRFVIRSVAGVPVIDGTLRDEGGTLVIVTAGGDSVRLTNPPDGLRAHIGKRVWITRAEDGGVASFGAVEG
jgi:hypothetical protein